jgi:hypothetical protein
MDAFLPAPRPEQYLPHNLHHSGRNWPMTNCYLDLWIEVLSALGYNPYAALGFTVTQDFEGDQFTFLKVPAEDLDLLFGISVQELAIYDRVELHAREQIRRGRLPLVEADSYYLPDTVGVSYASEHVKTLIGINCIDIPGRTLEYFHNDGYFRLGQEDFDKLFRRNGKHEDSVGDDTPAPYTEFAKLGTATPETKLGPLAVERLIHHLARRPRDNPFVAFSSAWPRQIEHLFGLPVAGYHRYAFNTSRQFGANFDLLAAHLEWLAKQVGLEATRAISAASRIAEGAKVFQFLMARAVARKNRQGIQRALDGLIEAYETLFEDLQKTFGRVEGGRFSQANSAGLVAGAANSSASHQHG